MPQKLPPRIDERWIRHDWRMWIRPDIARWMKPGVDPADVIPALARERAQQEAKRAREEAARAAQDAALAAAIEHERRALAALNEEVKELNADMARWRRRVTEEEAKYSPDQPRVPKRNPGAGQWTRIGGGIGQSPSPSVARPMGSVDIGAGSSETEGLFNIGADTARTDSANSSQSVAAVAADETGRRYSVNLAEEEARGGHTLRDHVGKTDAYLIGVMNADYERFTSGNLEITRFRDAEGTFATPEQANDFVNQLLKLEREKIDQFLGSTEPWVTLEARIGSVTGKEAFRPNGDSEPYIRDTYSVRAVLVPDSRSPRGYTVRTAFPVNQRAGRR